MEINKIDIKENAIRAIDSKLLTLLLRDKTTRKNILWATDDYVQYGEGYASHDEIKRRKNSSVSVVGGKLPTKQNCDTGCYQGYEIRSFQSIIEQTEAPSAEKSAEGVLRAV